MIDVQPSASGRIHSNVVTRCLSPVSMAVGGFTAGQWYIYRNLIDIRAPTAGIRSRFAGDTAVWRFGNAFKSNETIAPDGPHDVFHNTFLVYDQEGQAAPALPQRLEPASSPVVQQYFRGGQSRQGLGRADHVHPTAVVSGSNRRQSLSPFRCGHRRRVPDCSVHFQVRRLPGAVLRHPRRISRKPDVRAERDAISSGLRGERTADRSALSTDQRRRRAATAGRLASAAGQSGAFSGRTTASDFRNWTMSR